MKWYISTCIAPQYASEGVYIPHASLARPVRAKGMDADHIGEGRTHWWESSNELLSIGVEVLLGVVDGHTTIDTSRQGIVRHDRNTLVGAVLVLEEEHSSPVVGKVLGEGAGCAGSLLANVAGHVGCKGISADDLWKR